MSSYRQLLGFALAVTLMPSMSASSTLPVFFGTYTPASGVSRGVYTAQLDLVTGALTAPAFAAEGANPTFIAWRPDGRALYALGEKGTVNGKPGGALAAFRFDSATGQLSSLNTEATGGGPLAHVNVDQSGRVAVAISYHAGEVSSFPINADGSLGKCVSVLKTAGALGPNAKRQEKPHAHSATFSPDNRFIYVCDLGLDRIFRYTFDVNTAVLTPAGETATAAGAGPRHSKFSADGKFFYVINELNCTVAAYAVDPTTGALTAIQSIPTLPADFKGESICAEIRLSPDGRFVYGSNRGHDSLAVYARDTASGKLSLVEIVSCGGKHPRNFNLTPDGRWLLCANRDTDNVVVFQVDQKTGALTPAGHEIKVPQAVCVLFAR